ncbi:MAG TPA: acyl-CoA dehydrogenase family protein [Solirubrobacteraceae bacterium]|nr:acyl-CoA dehydrogenase family protein [Solirubrobacteraceae bacterium]
MTTIVSHRTLSESQGFWQALEAALTRIQQTADERDREVPRRFPADAFALLREAGALAWSAHPGERRQPADLELCLVRRVAAADGSVGRIFDGHVNAVERLAVQGPAEITSAELQAVCDRGLLAGVWGGEPGPDDGPPAAIAHSAGGEVIRGVKTFCSGAGGLDRAAVLVRDEAEGPPALVWIDLGHEGVEIDRSWYRAAGLVASESHRVVFHDVPVMARLGPPGAIAAQPWFSRDALRTTASWAGMADTAVRGALASLAQRPRRGELEALAAGRILTAQRTIDSWLSAAAVAIDGGDPELPAIAVHARVAVADACRTLLDEAAQACGSTPFARGGDLDRARRDLELFLLQHRLDPLLVRLGSVALERIS